MLSRHGHFQLHTEGLPLSADQAQSTVQSTGSGRSWWAWLPSVHTLYSLHAYLVKKNYTKNKNTHVSDTSRGVKGDTVNKT